MILQFSNWYEVLSMKRIISSDYFKIVLRSDLFQKVKSKCLCLMLSEAESCMSHTPAPLSLTQILACLPSLDCPAAQSGSDWEALVRLVGAGGTSWN